MSDDSYTRCEEADKDVKSGPHAWIQWKGTDACMDIHCSCGALTHVDADFAYHVQCGSCGKFWHMCSNVRMIEALPDGVADLKHGVSNYVRST